jgi:hypothetical protein
MAFRLRDNALNGLLVRQGSFGFDVTFRDPQGIS